ncbi:hypothetical protein HOG17_04905 [Candidatus Peregrinibacteria bacterium]|jgi:hypothetical protein|nr:hypothetical protein [Candidatus Peregrinibacteria bacterium]MBT4148523.1 hypothetical protein [Candidatus Peregrinibacteria bacterium]MBT4365868.1 hypothetical protein [Candidatus Peregrinibacteria bacterium]MBT4455536.1 hypothetical protein [Candidatus Peregrinibacteria bacterium]
MFKFKKQWKLNFKGHDVVVENWWDLILRTGERLIIDGKVVDEHKGSVGLSQELKGQIRSNGRTHRVEAKIGSINFGSKSGCHIYVDGELMGGDTTKKFVS